MSYSSTTEFGRLGVAAAYLAGLSADEQAEGLAVGYDTCNGYFRAAGYPIPIDSAYVGHDVKRAECAVAAWATIEVRGVNPESEQDKALRLAYEDAIRWLTGVAKGTILPFPAAASVGSSSEENTADPVLVCDDLRGW